MNEFNILGKVDTSKTIISPDAFHFRMKEALEVNNVDYEKFKKTVIKNPAIEPTQEWLDKEKDKRFQSLFKELWPNVYNRISEADTQKSITANEYLKNLETNRAYYDAMVKKDLEHYRAAIRLSPTLPTIGSNHCCCWSNTHSHTIQKPNDNLNICICGLNSTRPNIKVSTTPSWSHSTTLTDKSSTTKTIELPKYPNTISSYDFPHDTSKYCEKLVKSSYNPDELTGEAKLLKSIQESQEKLKMAQKLEKTTDLVDDIIGKVKVLQDEMKRKSASLQLKSDMEDMRKKRELLHSLHLHNELYHHKSRERLASSKSPHRHRTTSSSSSSSSRERNHHSRGRSHSRETKSILKTSRPISSLKHNPSFSFHHSRSKSAKSPCRHHHHHHDDLLVEKYGKDWSYVDPKVDCWNCNCKHDKNVY